MREIVVGWLGGPVEVICDLDGPEVEAFLAAIAASEGILAAPEPYVRQYRSEMLTLMDEPVTAIDDVWDEVSLPGEIFVEARGDALYLSLECNVAWEEEHGMQLVFDRELRIVKVSPYDGHLTNAAAYADDKLVGVVYVSLARSK